MSRKLLYLNVYVKLIILKCLCIKKIHKLSCIGCSDKIICWFSSYISGRKHRVVFNGQASDKTPGRSTSCVHSWALFIPLYINDIGSDIGCPTRLFADDTSLYFVVDSPP